MEKDLRKAVELAACEHGNLRVAPCTQCRDGLKSRFRRMMLDWAFDEVSDGWSPEDMDRFADEVTDLALSPAAPQRASDGDGERMRAVLQRLLPLHEDAAEALPDSHGAVHRDAVHMIRDALAASPAAPADGELLEAAKRMDALMELLWKCVPWGQTFDLPVRELNEAPTQLKAAIAAAEALPVQQASAGEPAGLLEALRDIEVLTPDYTNPEEYVRNVRAIARRAIASAKARGGESEHG